MVQSVIKSKSSVHRIWHRWRNEIMKAVKLGIEKNYFFFMKYTWNTISLMVLNWNKLLTYQNLWTQQQNLTNLSKLINITKLIRFQLNYDFIWSRLIIILFFIFSGFSQIFLVSSSSYREVKTHLNSKSNFKNTTS